MCGLPHSLTVITCSFSVVILSQGYLIVSVLFGVRRFWNIFGEKEVCAVWKCNEEFCHIIVDTGIFDHHLPDSVLGAVERLYQHQISGREKLPDAAVNVNTPRRGRAKTVAATLDREDDNIKKWKKVLPVTYFYSHTKSDGSRRGSEPTCTIDDNQAEANEESITVADVNGNTTKTVDGNVNTDKTVDVNENTIEVTVHISPEGENGLTFVQETSSTTL